MLARHGGAQAREALRGACIDDILRRREPAADPACRKAIADALVAVSSKDLDTFDVAAIAKQEADSVIADALARIKSSTAALEPVPMPPPPPAVPSPKERTSSTKLFGRLSHNDNIDEEAEENDDEGDAD